MSKLFYLLLIICLASEFCNAQSDTEYYDYSWKKTGKADAVHLCTFKKEDELYASKCYYIKNGKRSLAGYSIYKDSLVLDGYVDFFNEKGMKDVDAFFQSNVPSGIWEYYRDGTGKKWYTRSYKYGETYEINSYYENGKLKRHELHDTVDARQVTGSCYNEEGKEIPFTPFEIMAKPVQDIQQHIARTMHYPRNARENGIMGRVFVKFIVDTDGHITNIGIAKPLSPDIDSEAVRVVSLLPPWAPAKQDDKNVKVYFTLPITFKLE